MYWIYSYPIWSIVYYRFCTVIFWQKHNMCQSSSPYWFFSSYLHGSTLRCHIKGCMHYINNCRYSDMKSIAYKCIPFANRLLGFELAKFDQIVTCVNQVSYYASDPNTCMVVPWGIISKDGCIFLAIVDTQMWKVLHINVSILPIVH